MFLTTDFSGLPTDRPVNFDDIEAFELRNAGRVEVFVFVAADPVDGRAGVLPRPPALRAQRPLQPDSQLPGAGRQAGADPGSPTNTGGCAEARPPAT